MAMTIRVVQNYPNDQIPLTRRCWFTQRAYGLSKTASDHISWETQFLVTATINIRNQHIHIAMISFFGQFQQVIEALQAKSWLKLVNQMELFITLASVNSDPNPQKVPPPNDVPPMRSNVPLPVTWKQNTSAAEKSIAEQILCNMIAIRKEQLLGQAESRFHLLHATPLINPMIPQTKNRLTLAILTPEPILTSKYGNKLHGSTVWNLYRTGSWWWYVKDSSGIFLSKKLHPLIRHSISSSLSTLKMKNDYSIQCDNWFFTKAPNGL